MYLIYFFFLFVCFDFIFFTEMYWYVGTDKFQMNNNNINNNKKKPDYKGENEEKAQDARRRQ